MISQIKFHLTNAQKPKASKEGNQRLHINAVLERQELLENCILDTDEQFEFIFKQITTQQNQTSPPGPTQPPTKKQAMFAEIIKTGPTHPSKPANIPLPNKLTTMEILTLPNQFKKFRVTIRPRFGQTRPFIKKNPLEIINTINGALLEVNAKTDNTPVQIKAIT
ncbi:hypothetical protein O181_009651 [Austropuccinia psidii MF-1]|uniref:Uncharacterized protein n=1 Tax=Austropuccinia psidii MF-1 TaxID=1389203 RepID=A0A9Q3BPN5_9BASI|nr:hypothetical protein [Austropuccinia psidii MF-1]